MAKTNELNLKDLLKKYWFVAVVLVLSLVFVIAYTIDAIANKPVTVNTKDVDGTGVVIEVDDKYFTADELYDILYNVYGVSHEYTKFTEYVLNETYETTKEMQENANNYYSYYLQYYGEAELAKQMAQMGYSGGASAFVDYIITAQKNDLMLKEYYTEHYDEFIAPLNPKKISHILVKVASVDEVKDAEGNVVGHTANPTAEETAKLNEVLEALKTKDFAEVAKEYSEDGSAEQGGYLSITDSNNASNYVLEFKNECIALNAGETSDVITTQFGYHIIKAEEVSAEEVLNDPIYVGSLNGAYQNDYVKATMALADKLDVEIFDERLKTTIEELVKDGE